MSKKNKVLSKTVRGVLANVGGLAIWIGLLALLIGGVVAFMRGAGWAVEHLLEPLWIAALIAFGIDALILLPLSVVRKLRSFTGLALYLSSIVFGIVTWLVGFVVSYVLWGAGAVIVGLFFLGIGVVPIGLVAAVFNQQWFFCCLLLALCLVTYGSRALGMWVVCSLDEGGVSSKRHFGSPAWKVGFTERFNARTRYEQNILDHLPSSNASLPQEPPANSEPTSNYP